MREFILCNRTHCSYTSSETGNAVLIKLRSAYTFVCEYKEKDMTKEYKQLLEMAQVFHMSKMRIFRYIILPSLFGKK